MTDGTSQGLFIVVAIVIFGIFVGLAYTAFGDVLQPKMVTIFETALDFKVEGGGSEGTPEIPVDPEPETPIDPNKIVIFENKNLENKVRSTLSLGQSESITVAKLAKLTSIVIPDSDSKIDSLKGLEYAVNLNKVEILWSDVTDLEPLKKLEKLKTVNLPNNKITDLTPLSNLTSLTWLDLMNNQIKDVKALKNLINLTYLRLNSNEITDVSDLSNLTKLTYLSLSNNQITDFSKVEKLPKLEVIFK